MTEMRPFSEGTQFAVVLERIGRGVLAQLEDVSDAVLNAPLQLPEMNTLFALATHIAGSSEFWVLEMAGGKHVGRDRPAEFHARGTRAELVTLYERWLTDVHEVLERFPHEEMDRLTTSPEEYRTTGGLGDKQLTVRECLLHAVEHAALHLGHIQITRQLLASGENSVRQV